MTSESNALEDLIIPDALSLLRSMNFVAEEEKATKCQNYISSNVMNILCINDVPLSISEADLIPSTSLSVDSPIIAPSNGLRRAPLILYAVLDTSKSMKILARGAEDDNFSLMDLVKHTMRTLITGLTEEDQICIIQFSTKASVFIPLTKLATNAVKEDLQARLFSTDEEMQLKVGGRTNIFAGLRLAIDQVDKLSDEVSSEANVQIYLLTDGEETDKYYSSSLAEALDSHRLKKHLHPHRRLVINTFGYGYEIDSKLLYDVARRYNGFFGFIPDSSMVGTVFINALTPSTKKTSVPQKIAKTISELDF